MDALNLKCGQCGHINELPEGWDEPFAFCVKCGHKIHVPRSEDAADADKADFADKAEVGFAEQARRSEGKKVSITCPQCGKTVKVSARVAGRKARCKACNAPMDIPYPDDIEPVEFPRLRQGARETGLDLVAPDEIPSAEVPDEIPSTEAPDERDAMLDLLPEPVQEDVDDEGTHDPLQVVIPLTQDEPSAPNVPHAPPEPAADLAHDFPQASVEAEETGQLASAVKDFQSGREAVLARRRRAAAIRKLIWAGAGLAVCVGLVFGIAAFWPSLFPEQQQFVDITDNTSPGPDGPDSGSTQPSGRRPTSGAVAAAGSNGGSVRPTPIANPPAQKARCDLVGLVTRTFGAGGYHPASVGSIYWQLTAKLKAGKEPIEFKAMGKDIQLVFNGKAVDSLGVPAGASNGGALLPRIGRQERVSVKPGQTRRVTLLFEVPTGVSEGEVVIGKLRWPFKMVPGTAAIPMADLAGTFVELPPRNLKPMLANPVMAAIQAVGGQRMAVKANGSGLEVEIPEARVRGKASPAGRDVYALSLTCGQDKLAANLRFTEGGRTAILYLADKPFHQITYVNPARPVPNKNAGSPAIPKPTPAPSRTEPDRRPIYTPPKSEPKPEDPITLPTGPSFFD